MINTTIKSLLILLSLSQTSSCSVFSIADTVASTAIGAVKVGAKGTATVIGAVFLMGMKMSDELKVVAALIMDIQLNV